MGRNFLDIHPSLTAGHNHRPAGGAIHEDGEIKFLLDLDRFGDEHLIDHASLGTRLVGDEGLPEHLGREIAGLPGRFAKMHTALEPVGESPLATSSGMDLRFDHDGVGAEIVRHFFRFGRAAGHRTARVVRAEFGQKFLGLVFVDIHGVVGG